MCSVSYAVKFILPVVRGKSFDPFEGASLAMARKYLENS